MVRARISQGCTFIDGARICLSNMWRLAKIDRGRKKCLCFSGNVDWNDRYGARIGYSSNQRLKVHKFMRGDAVIGSYLERNVVFKIYILSYIEN